jgi:hypothetical protein
VCACACACVMLCGIFIPAMICRSTHHPPACFRACCSAGIGRLDRKGLACLWPSIRAPKRTRRLLLCRFAPALSLKYSNLPPLTHHHHVDGQRAPIFMQWVECVWQMLRQAPLAFEYNERLRSSSSFYLFVCGFYFQPLPCGRTL